MTPCVTATGRETTCPSEATVAIRTTHGGKDTVGLKTTVWSAPEDPPKSASLYCTMHGAELLADLVRTLSPQPSTT